MGSLDKERLNKKYPLLKYVGFWKGFLKGFDTLGTIDNLKDYKPTKYKYKNNTEALRADAEQLALDMKKAFNIFKNEINEQLQKNKKI